MPKWHLPLINQSKTRNHEIVNNRSSKVFRVAINGETLYFSFYSLVMTFIPGVNVRHKLNMLAENYFPKIEESLPKFSEKQRRITKNPLKQS